jgi:integrase
MCCPHVARIAPAVKKTVNDRLLKSLKPAKPGQRYEVMDSIVPGFGVRVTDKGRRTFVLVARYPGSPNPTRRALGEYGALSLDKAREKARRWIEVLRQGRDPRAEEENQKFQELRQQENSFAAVAEEFIRLAVIGPDPKNPKQRKGPVVERELRREFIERWAKRTITSITPHDVIAVLDAAVTRGAPYQAHNLLGHIRRLFNWAIARGVYGLDRSPCDRMKPKDVIGKKALRTRILRDVEIQALWRATEQMGYPYGPLFQLLALTGQRKSEVSDARWSEFDLQRKLWTIPAERMKADAPHTVPLTSEAIKIVETLPRFQNGGHLFSTTFGQKPVSGFSKAKTRLDSLMLDELRSFAVDSNAVEIEPWTIHDIRRTVRTGLSALPIPDLVRELVIAHAKPGLHKVYDQYAYLNEKRQALELWATRLRAIVRDTAPQLVAACHTES